MIKVWIAGSNGQIGRALNDILDPLEIEVLNTDVDDLDITNTEEVLNFGIVNRPDVIINCCGVTDTDLCEKEPEHAYRVKWAQNSFTCQQMTYLTDRARNRIQNLMIRIH